MYYNGEKITYSVSEDDVSAPGFYETIVTKIDNSMESTSTETMVYTEGDKTITFYYDSTAPHININGVAYPYSTANWVNNGDGTYSLTFTYSHNPDTSRYDSPLTYTSTWVYDSNKKVYTYISDDYMVVNSIRYATYVSTSGVEKVLYDANNYVSGVTSVTRDERDNEVARNYYYYVEQADAYRDDVYYSQEFWSTNRAIEDMPAVTTIRVGYNYTYGYFDKFGEWHSDSGVATQVFNTGSGDFNNICDKASQGDTQRGFDVVLQLSDAVLYYGDGLKETYNVDITNTPVSSLEVSKNVTNPDKMPDAAQEFELKITLDKFLGSTISGTFAATINDTATTVTFTDGVATVKLNHGEKIVINGLPKGVGYTVEEINIPANYTASYENGTGFVGTDNAAVNNTYTPPRTEGDLVLKKEISHPFGTDYTVSTDLSFEIKVKLEDGSGRALANKTFNTTIDNVTVTTDTKGEFTVTLKNNESIEILNLPLGTVVTVEEQSIPAGFIATYQPKSTATIASDETSYITVVNSYDPDPAQVTIDLSGVKTVDGQWGDEIFTFYLQKFVDGNWVTIATDTATKTDPNIDFDADKETMPLEFDAIGEYEYQVIEANHGLTIDGITYDSTMHTFKVVVTDNNMDGVLEAVVVSDHNETQTGDFTFNAEKNTWENKSVNFENIINRGSAGVTIMIKKALDNNVNSPLVSLAGYKFDVYSTDENYNVIEKVATTVATDITGETYFSKVYEWSENETETYYYQLKEAATNIAGMTDSAAIYNFKVVVTSDNEGNVKAEIFAGNGTSFGTFESAAGITYNLATFKNVYDLTDAEILLPVTKNLTGKTLEDGTFTFNVYKVTAYDSENNTAVVDWNTVVATAKNGETLKITDFDKVGTYYYAVKEVNDSLPGVTYDDTVYYVKVTVSDNGKGALTAEYSVINGTALVFNNAYKAEPTSVVLTADKELYTDETVSKAKELTAGMFTFTLVEVDENGKVVAGGENQTVTNTAYSATAPEVVFSEIEYTEEGTYYYRVTETAGTLGGITYDSNEYIYKVVVGTEINGTTASLHTSVTVTGTNVENNRAVFKNTYSAAPVKLPVSGTKVFENATLEPGMFAFGLYASDANGTAGDLLYTAANDAAGNFIFEKDTYDGDGNFVITDVLTFTKEGTYYYVVKEVIPENPQETIIYDTTAYLLTVVVTDNGNGKLVAIPTFTKLGETPAETSGVVFENKALVSCSLTITGEKVLEGKNLKDGQFSFVLYHVTYSEADGWTKGLQHGKAVKNDADGKFSFPAIEYVTTGTHYYIVEEVTPKTDTENMAYDRTQRYITVSVTDPGNGILAAEIVSVEGNLELSQDAAKEIVFNNKYTPSPVYVTIEGEKILTGRDWTDTDEFVFELYKTASDYIVAEGRTPVDTQTVTALNDTSADGGKLYEFDAIPFNIDSVGTNYFVITEKAGDINGVTYDVSQYQLKIDVTYDSDRGHLTAEIAEITKVTAENPTGEEAETVVFNNEYTAKGTFSLNGIKTIVNRDWTEDDEFVFAIYETGADFKVGEDATPLATTTSTDGTFEFTDIPVENTPHDLTDAGTYDGVKHYYVVVEQAGNDATMIYDDTVYHVTVETKDNLDGTLSSGRFEDGTFVQGEYVIEKVTEETVLFIFKTVKTESATEIEFVNVYNTQPVKIDVNGTKVLTGSQTDRRIKSGEFTFQLWSATIDSGSWNEDELIATTTNNAQIDGQALFTFDSDSVEQLTFTQAGEYLFIVKEAQGTNPIVDYDTTEYNVKVDVTVQDDPLTAGIVELEAKVYLISGDESVEITDPLAQASLMTFENQYNDTAVSIHIFKQLIQNGKISDTAEGFTFIVEDENGKVITNKLISDADGFAGHTFFYDEDDIGKTYTYKIYEKAGNMKGMVYDDTVYTVVVKLTEEDGEMFAEVTVTADGAEYGARNLVFTNKYTSEKPYSPDTGDHTGVMMYAATFATATMALIAVILLKRKREE